MGQNTPQLRGGSSIEVYSTLGTKGKDFKNILKLNPMIFHAEKTKTRLAFWAYKPRHQPGSRTRVAVAVTVDE